MSEEQQPSSAEQPAERPAERGRALLDVDLVPDQTSDDTDEGWGSSGSAREDRDPATVLRRYLDEKPPHHGD